jgi:GTP-binding protein
VFETIEKFSIIKTLNAIEQSNIAVLIIDGKDGLSAQDLHILAFVIETGRSLVVAVNKWDLLDYYEKDKIKNQIDRKLSFANFAEVVFISAIKKRGFSEMIRAIKKAYLSSQKKLSTPQINSVLENALISHPPKIIKGIRPKLKYAHQGGLNPPQIIIHGNHLNEIKKDYIVFLESFFRKSFQLVGTPIKVLLKNSENPFEKKDSKPMKTGLVTRRKIKNDYREKLNKKNISN